jgi:phosphoglycolate phosphatase-like HAD superfamily hydrolase
MTCSTTLWDFDGTLADTSMNSISIYNDLAANPMRTIVVSWQQMRQR